MLSTTRLIDPLISITDPDARQKARILASITLLLMAVYTLLLIFWIAVGETRPIQLVMRFLGYALLMICYWLSRLARHQVAGVLLITCGSLVLLVSSAIDTELEIYWLDYLILIIIFGSLFLTRRELVIVFSLQLIGMVVFPQFGGTYTLVEIALGPLSFNILAGMIVFLTIYYHEVSEKFRRHELIESRERYRTFFDNSVIGIYQSTREGRFTMVNPALAAMLGYTVDEMLALQLPDDLYADPQDRRKMQLLYEPDRQIQGAELVWKKKSGDLIYITVHGRVVTDSTYKVIGYEGLVVDISDQKQAALRLQQSEQRYESVVAALAEGVMVVDENGAITTSNASAERILGLSKSQLLGRTPYDPRWRTIHEDGSEFVGEAHPVIISLRTGKPQREVMMGVYKPDGSLGWISINSQPFILDGVPQGVVASFTDVTRRKAAEENLITREAEFRLLLETIPLGVVKLDRNGTITFVNRAYNRMLDYRGDELLNTKLWDVMADEERRRQTRERYPYLMTGSPTPSSLIEKYVTRNGRVIDVQLDWNYNYDESAKVIGCVVVISDITERKRAEEQAMQLALEKARVQILSNFLKDVSHEFRTPLSVIYMNTSILHQLSESNSQKDCVQTIDEQVEHIVKLVDTLVTMSRLDVDAELSFSEVNLNHLGQVLHTRFQPIAQHNGLVLHFLPDSEPVRIQADPQALGQAFSTLLENAIRYTESGGSVQMVVTRRGTLAEVVFQDTGVGISSEMLPHIFERFYRADRPRTTRGMGLGLSIAAKIVEGHGGKIEVESEVGRGSLFRVLLPLDVQAMQE